MMHALSSLGTESPSYTISNRNECPQQSYLIEQLYKQRLISQRQYEAGLNYLHLKARAFRFFTLERQIDQNLDPSHIPSFPWDKLRGNTSSTYISLLWKKIGDHLRKTHQRRIVDDLTTPYRQDRKQNLPCSLARIQQILNELAEKLSIE